MTYILYLDSLQTQHKTNMMSTHMKKVWMKPSVCVYESCFTSGEHLPADHITRSQHSVIITTQDQSNTTEEDTSVSRPTLYFHVIWTLSFRNGGHTGGQKCENSDVTVIKSFITMFSKIISVEQTLGQYEEKHEVHSFIEDSTWPQMFLSKLLKRNKREWNKNVIVETHEV